ncbi:MAG TPA: methyltransferase domain-containing protein [Rhizomicrobium sp.]|jgi:ubiquinone/menaquinone biosynthesis C-methylase UbiE|nr:methyltransferase domain-containing protein [Rhizomicrobium sp.]
MPNAQYNVARPDSLPVRVAAHQRRKMFAAFVKTMAIPSGSTLLDVGATSDRSYDHSNYLEAWYSEPGRITAVGIDDASFLETIYPGLTFVQADGRDLPFADGAFDFVHSSAVLEHVGSAAMQARFLRELWRVARMGVFVTTPNRWYPIEFHTVLPLLHWLPVRMHRWLLRRLGHEMLAKEENLNLLSRRSLRKAALAAGMKSIGIGSVSLLGLPTNLLLRAQKN